MSDSTLDRTLPTNPRGVPGAGSGADPSRVCGAVAIGRPRQRSVTHRSAAAMALVVYTLLLIGRLPELVAQLQAVRPILIVALVTMALALLLSPTRLPRVLHAPEARAVLAIVLLGCASVPGSVWPGQSVRFMVFSYSKTILFFFLLLYCIRRISEFRRLTWAFVGAIASLELAALLAKVQGRVRITSTYDPNDLAFVMVCALPIAVALLPVARGLLRVILPGVVALALMTIIMTKSRGGFVALLVVGPLLLIKLPSRVPFLKAGVLIAGILVFALFAPSSYWERMGTIWGSEDRRPASDGYLEGGLTTARLDIWKTGIRLMLENPLFGVGVGSFQFAEGLTHKKGPWFAPHNSFIQMGAELGLAGLALFLFLLYRAVRNCREVIRTAKQDRRLQYHLSIAHGIEISIYGFAAGAFGLTQAYSDIFYLLLAMSVLLKWLTPRPDGHPSPGVVARHSATASGLPWWKAPR